MWKKFFLGSVVGLLFLILSVMGSRGRTAEPLTPDREAALVSLADLGPRDMRPKRATVEIYASPNPEMNSFHRLLQEAWPIVQAFTAAWGWNWKWSRGRPRPAIWFRVSACASRP